MIQVSAAEGWNMRLRRICLVLFALLPAFLLLWRGGTEIVIALISASYLAMLLTQRERRIALQPALAALLIIWIVLNVAVSPLAFDPLASFSRSLLWLRFGLLFAAVTTWLIRTPDDLRLVVLGWGGIAALAVIDGLVQLLTGVSLSGRPIERDRLTGPLDRPNIGMFVARTGLVLTVALAALACHETLPRRRQGLYAISGAVALVALGFILVTGERAASLLSILAIATALGLVVLVSRRYRWHALALFGTAAVALVGIIASSERLMWRLEAFVRVASNFWTSAYGELFGAGLAVWREYPILGAGMKNFKPVCDILMAGKMSDGCHAHPHNVYIEWLSDTGLVGLTGYLVFLVIIVLPVFRLLRGDTNARLAGAVTAGCFVLLLFPLTASQSFFSNWPAMLFWASLSLVIASMHLAQRR